MSQENSADLRNLHGLILPYSPGLQSNRLAREQLPKDSQNILKELKSVADVRNIEKVKARFLIIDNKEIAFMLLDDDKVHPTYDSGVWINTKFFAETLENFFEACWNKMKPAGKYLKAQ